MSKPGSSAKTRAGRRALIDKAPKVVENAKKVLYLHGSKCSGVVQAAFKDLHALTQPNSQIFSRKSDQRPFEDEAPLEALSSKHDVSLFVVGTHNKKRPHNIIIARMYNHRLLDMCELGLDETMPLTSFKGVDKNMAGSKPCILFQGQEWETELSGVRSILLDLFRGEAATAINLAGLDHVLAFSTDGTHIYLHHYRIQLKKSVSRVPLVHLVEIGPRSRLHLRRTRWAASDLMQEAMRRPKTLIPKKVKNIEYTETGDKLGRVHLGRQDLSQIQTRKMKGLKRGGGGGGEKAAASAASAAAAAAAATEPNKRSRRSKESQG